MKRKHPRSSFCLERESGIYKTQLYVGVLWACFHIRVTWCFGFKTASVMKEQLEQLTKNYSNVTSVHMDIIKDEEKLSSLVKKHDLVIRSEFWVK